MQNGMANSARTAQDRDVTIEQQSAELADANHILFDQGVLDAFGHVSVRVEDDPGRFLLSRNLAPTLVTAADVQVIGLDGEPEDGRRPYLERFIHASIYRARPDVAALVHSHSLGVIPFGVSNVPLAPLFHMAGFLAEGVGRFEIRDQFGDGTDLLVRSEEIGDALAASLGSGSVVLMRGHGSVVVGPSLRLAVYRAIYTEVNARLQADVIRLGEWTPLTTKEGLAAADTIAGQVDRAWGMWLRRAEQGSVE